MDSTNMPSDVVEMLMSHLDKIEHMLKLQDTSARLTDSLRPLGTPFSGVTLTGKCVTLTVHHPFDSHGNFDNNGGREGDILIINPSPPGVECENITWSTNSHWRWDGELSDAWGNDLCESTRASMIAHYKFVAECTCPYFHYPPSCKDLGIESGYESVQDAMYETVLRRRVPGLLAVGEDYIAVSMCSITEAVKLASRVMSECQVTEELNDVTMYVIPKWYQSLALAVLRANGAEEAYSALDRHHQNSLKRGDEPFFTKLGLWFIK